MFTDMVGYSRLMSEDEDKAIQLVETHNELLLAILGKHGGHVLKTMGDAFFAELPSALGAFNCAVEIQQRLKVHNEEAETGDKIVIRIGLHMGDVIVRGDDLFGEGVNIAARLEPMAEPGGICLSELFYQSIKKHTDVDAVYIGEVELKNILQKQVIYKIPSFYPMDVEEVAEKSRPHENASVYSLNIKGIEKMRPPKSLFESMLNYVLLIILMIPIISIGFMLSILFIFAYLGPHRSYYEVDRSDLLNPISIFENLKEADTDPIRLIRNAMSARFQNSLRGLDIKDLQNENSAERDISALLEEFNFLILRKKPIVEFDRLNDRSGEYLKELIDENETNPFLLNRRILEAAFNNDIEKLRVDPYYAVKKKTRHFDWVWSLLFSLDTWREIWQEVTVCIGLILLGGYFGTMRRIRILLDDVRQVDPFLRVVLQDAGFKDPVERRGELVYKKSIIDLGGAVVRARVDGNSVVITTEIFTMRWIMKKVKVGSAG